MRIVEDVEEVHDSIGEWIYTRPKKKRRILNIHFIWGDFHQSLANDLSQFERCFLDYEFLGLC